MNFSLHKTTNKVLLTASSAFIVLAHLVFEYYHGGVVTHYILQDGSLPGISNWWGLISLPTIVWFTLLGIEKRKESSVINDDNSSTIKYRLVSGIIFGLIVSYLFSIESGFLDYLMLGLFVLSLFIPLYFGEYLVGFTLGTMYMFGANIPIIGGLILLTVFFALFKLTRFILNFIRSKV